MPEEQRTQGESAGASVKAAAKTGKAVSDIAKGAATGGAHGAALAAVKHSKKWIGILVGLLLLPILIVAMLPVIIFGSLFGTGTDTPSGITDDAVLTQNMVDLNAGTLKGLSLINRESIDAIRTAVWELEKARYITRQHIRTAVWELEKARYITRQQNRDGRGKMADMVYTIYEQPQPRPEAAQGEQPGLENPVLENPTSDNPTSENPVSGNPMHMDGGLDSVNGIVDGLVVRLGCTLHIDGAVQMSRIVDAGKPAELLEQGRTLLLRDKVGGRHSVRQQLQFRQFKNTGTDEVAVLFAFHADNIVAGVQQEPDISVHILPVGTDARIFPISQDIRTGYEMGFIRLFIQQLQQQEQAALIIFLQRNSPIYSLGPDFRPQVQSYWGRISGPRSNLIPPRPH